VTVVQAFPDIEALCAEQVRETLSARVYSSIPRDPVYPLITVKRIGGVPAVRERLDSARLQLDVWGTSKSEARDLADQARVVLHGMESKVYSVTGGDAVNAVVTGVVDNLGLTWLPDPVTDRDRYIFGVVIYAHSTP
jgi:hypothetical protein